MTIERELWIQSIYKTPLLDGVKFSEFISNYGFCMNGKIICSDLVEGPIINSLLTEDGYPFFKPDRFLNLLRKPLTVEWMDVYISDAQLTISSDSGYEDTLKKVEMLVRAVDGGYIYTYVPRHSRFSKIHIASFLPIEVIEGPLSELSFPG